MPRMKSPRLLDHEISAALDRDAREVPGASEIIFAIGAVLAAHLAVALAICGYWCFSVGLFVLSVYVALRAA